MANLGSESGGATDQQIQQINYQDYVDTGGDPTRAQLDANNQIRQGGSTNQTSTPTYDPNALYAAAARAAAYDVGGGHTRWDEFVQQMQLEQDKLNQAKALQEEQLAQQKALEEQRLQEQQKIADQNTVEAYNKELMGMKGPADPYGYLFSSRGLSAPRGYAPTAAPIPQAVLDAYKTQGIDLAGAQKQVTGGSGPSFINGYLGGMPNSLQQGPMGFQNSSSDSQSQSQPSGQSGVLSQNPAPTPSMKMATGGTVPGYAPGSDSVPAMLSPGEGVLKPQVVQAMGGPAAIDQLNTQGDIQTFADGGITRPNFPQLPGRTPQLGRPTHWQRPPWYPPLPPTGGTSGPPQLMGGTPTPVGPPNGPVMNLNMLDPYTRSMVDEFGRPQIPSAQALANMPQSGADAYKNYVETVAGGNYQDLLDQSKMMNPSGISTPGEFKFS